MTHLFFITNQFANTKLKSLISTFFTAFTLCASAQIPNYVPQNGLKGFWTFDGNANDLTANANHGTIYGATFTSNRFNQTNKACLFNGNGDYVSTNFAGILGDTARAVSFWAKTPGKNGNPMYPIGWGGNTYGDRFGCGFDYPANKVFAGGGNCIQPYNTNSNIDDNQWHHYVFQFNPANGSTFEYVQVWQDAVPLATTTIGAYQPSLNLFTINSFNVTFGKIMYAMAPEYYLGALDEIGIWNRTLTQCEISDLYYSDLAIGTINFNTQGYTGAVNNLAQYTQTVSATNFPISIVAGVFSGQGVSYNNGLFNFNSSGALASGNYTITFTYTLQTGCVKSSTQTIKVNRETKTGINQQFDFSEKEFTIYPNPATDRITLKFNTWHPLLNCKIYDACGKLIQQATISNDNGELLFMPEISNGMYYLEISDNVVLLDRKKLIVFKN